MNPSVLQENASKGIINSVGATGSIAILPADDDLIVTSTNMKVGAYTVAAQPKSACRISILATAGDTADTMGTVTIVGTDTVGDALTETVTPIAGTTVYTVGHFSTITSVTGAGWVIDAVEGTNDTIKVGVDYSQAPAGYYIFATEFMADAVVASQTNVADAINVELSSYTSILSGVAVYGKWTKLTLTSGEAIGYLARLETQSVV